jgi:hypothetical protein
MHAQLHRQLDLRAVARIKPDRVDLPFELAQDRVAPFSLSNFATLKLGAV